MHIKEHGLHLCTLLYFTLLLNILLMYGGDAKKVPEVVMEPVSQYTQIQEQLKEQTSTQRVIPAITTEPVGIIPKYGFTEDEIYLMTVLLCGSAKKGGDGEYDFDHMKKLNKQQIYLVLNVVMNRVNSNEYPDTVSDTIWDKGQFSYMHNWKHSLPKVDQKSYAVVEQWCRSYDAWDTSVVTVPSNHLYFAGNGRINKSRARH